MYWFKRYPRDQQKDFGEKRDMTRRTRKRDQVDSGMTGWKAEESMHFLVLLFRCDLWSSGRQLRFRTGLFIPSERRKAHMTQQKQEQSEDVSEKTRKELRRNNGAGKCISRSA